MDKKTEKLWEDLSAKVINNIKVFILGSYTSHILRHFNRKVDYLVRRYSRVLPSFVVQSEVDDLKTVAQLELFESLKIWDPSKSADVWPIAYSRIVGAMKDHIRYITKSDPSRFYDWVNEAAIVMLSVNKSADFAKKIDTGLELKQAMEVLDAREKKVVKAYIQEEMTFSKIGEQFSLSESQISRIFKKAVGKIKTQLETE